MKKIKARSRRVKRQKNDMHDTIKEEHEGTKAGLSEENEWYRLNGIHYPYAYNAFYPYAYKFGNIADNYASGAICFAPTCVIS